LGGVKKGFCSSEYQLGMAARVKSDPINPAPKQAARLTTSLTASLSLFPLIDFQAIDGLSHRRAQVKCSAFKDDIPIIFLTQINEAAGTSQVLAAGAADASWQRWHFTTVIL